MPENWGPKPLRDLPKVVNIDGIQPWNSNSTAYILTESKIRQYMKAQDNQSEIPGGFES